jgi:hypothetical protein
VTGFEVIVVPDTRRPGGLGFRLGFGLLLVRADDHDHVSAVLLRRALDVAELRHIGGHPLKQPVTHLRAGLLATPEHDHDFDLVTRVQETLDVALFRPIVVWVDLEPKPDLLEHRVRLVLARFTVLDR